MLSNKMGSCCETEIMCEIWFREEGFVKYMDAASPEYGKYHTNRLFSISAYTSDCKKSGI